MAIDTADLQKTVQYLTDRNELIDLENLKGRYADEKREQDSAALRTADCVAIMKNGELRLTGEELTKQGMKFLDPFTKIQHMITNVLVDIDGDTAKIRANVVATHVYTDQPQAAWVVKGYYTDEARRTPDGWRFTQIQLHRIWEEDTRV